MAGGQYRDTHHTVSAGILEALGKGLLIATGGLMAGVLFGTAHLGDLSLWAVGVAAVSGVACVAGSALVRNLGLDGDGPEDEQSPPVAGTGKSPAASPAMETAAEVEECRARRRVEASRERGQGTGRCV